MSGSILAGLALDTTAQAILTRLADLATSAGLATLGGKLDTISARLAGTLTVDGSAVTQPISAATLPLPDGAATDAALSSLGSQLDTVSGLGGEGASASEETVALLEAILSRLGYADPSQGSTRVTVTSGQVNVGGTCAVSTLNQMSGYSTAYDQYAAMLACTQSIRAHITVTS